MKLLLLNKPFQVLTQFTTSDARITLRNYIAEPGLYPAGRLDYDSEGLLLLTDTADLQLKLSDPRWKTAKTYLVQVENEPAERAFSSLRSGVRLADGPTLPAQVESIPEPDRLWPRDPPIRFRKHIPTSWLRLTIREGRNRQVRRMTAAVGHPTLRLIRWSVGPWTVEGLMPGESRSVPEQEVAEFLAGLRPRPGKTSAVRARPGSPVRRRQRR